MPTNANLRRGKRAKIGVSGGRLVYAVCSTEPEEGPAVVEAVLAEAAPGHGFTLVAAQDLTPEHDGTEGFFVARLDRAAG